MSFKLCSGFFLQRAVWGYSLSISKLKQLEFLILKNNQLIGPIPSTLSQIPNLKVLDLAQNSLSGEIPRLIYWNEVLQYLGLRGNKLGGTLSPNMCQLMGPWYFDVRNNSLTGSIPENIGNCTAFQVLDLSYNQLTGEIPFNIGFLQVDTFVQCLQVMLEQKEARRVTQSEAYQKRKQEKQLHQGVEEVPVSYELLQNSDYNNQQPIVIEPLLQQNGKKRADRQQCIAIEPVVQQNSEDNFLFKVITQSEGKLKKHVSVLSTFEEGSREIGYGRYLYESSQHVSGLPTLFCHNHITKHSLGHVNHQPTGAIQNLKTTGPLSFKSLVRYFLQRVSSKKHLIRYLAL
ncbi:unnamed protein product [Coffea canephora]|uniref:Uncharacterized protein n=1 Tax=Coffea canephora TaxID=49390 RepID=A0A068UDA5_COFCA|nr:unnamed protein product [Coffea canephora]